MALVSLIQTFISQSEEDSKLEKVLAHRLPTLWQMLWLESMAVLRKCAGISRDCVNEDFGEDVNFIQNQLSFQSNQSEMVNLKFIL